MWLDAGFNNQDNEQMSGFLGAINMAVLEQGFYVLREDVDNPAPDRRSKQSHSVTTWKKGTRVFLRPKKDTIRGTICFEDGCTVCFGEKDDEINTGNGMIPVLEKAPFAIGQLFRYNMDGFAQAEMGDVLVLAFESGLLSLATINGLIATLNQTSIFKRVSELAKREWIKAGMPGGLDLDFWLIAEREVCCFVEDGSIGFDSPDGYYRINRKHPDETWHLEWEPGQ